MCTVNFVNGQYYDTCIFYWNFHDRFLGPNTVCTYLTMLSLVFLIWKAFSLYPVGLSPILHGRIKNENTYPSTLITQPTILYPTFT